MRARTALCTFLVVVSLFYGQSEAKLKLIQAVFRHGNRTPVKTSDTIYPNDPYKDLTFEPLGYGALTNKGKMTVFRLGEYLRGRYGDFLGPIYSPEMIRFQGDEVERVVMTGQLVAAALFPPTLSQRWHPLLRWQPIPVWFEPLDKDILFGGVACTNYKKMRDDLENSDKYLLKRQDENQEFFDFLAQHVGANVTQRTTFFLRQQLFAQEDIGLKLPTWTRGIYPNGKLEKLANYDVYIQSYTNEMKRLMGGVWVKQWLGHVKDHLNATSTRKAFMYPAHEYNIAGILSTLNSYDFKVPYYASCIVFELHEENGEYFVQVLHKDQSNVRLLQIPGCSGTMCPLEDFIEITSPLIPENEKEACGELNFDL